MRVKMITLSAGPNGVRKPGDIVKVTDAEGQALIAGRYAVLVDKAPKQAEKKPDENASTGGGKQNASTGGAPETAGKGKRKGKAAQ